jgi:arsenate reductase-like glutaredoxin family protein
VSLATLCVQCLQRQTGQPPTATLFVGIGETTDEVKRRMIRELEKELKELEPVLSKISDEEIVRLIREDREGCHSGDAP